MAKAGTVNEIADLEAIAKQKTAVLNELEIINKAIVETNKKAKSVGLGGSDVNGMNTQIQQTTKLKAVTKELTTEEIKQKQAKKEMDSVRQKEIASNNELIGAYSRLKAQWELAKKDQKDMVTAGNLTNAQLKEQAKLVKELDTKIKAVDRTVGEHQKNVGNYSSAMDGLKGSWMKIMAVWTAATVALGSIIALFKKGIESAMEDERANRKLTLALNGNVEAAQRFLRMKEMLMKQTMFSEDEIMQLINFGLAMGRSEKQTRELVTAAISLSNATGGLIDVSTAMNQLNATYQGDLGRLKRYTGELTEEQLRNGEAIDVVNQKYQKFLTEGVDTTEGKVKMMKQWWSEAWEDIGYGAMKAIQWLWNYEKAAFKIAAKLTPFGSLLPSDAETKAKESKRLQMEQLQAKQDNIKADTDLTNIQNPLLERLKAKIAAEEKETKVVKELTNAWDEYIRRMQAVGILEKARAQGTFVGPEQGGGIGRTVPSIQAQTVSGTQGPTPGPQTVPNVPFSEISEVMTPEEASQAEAAKWNARLQIASEFTAKLTALSDTFYQNELMKLDEQVQATQTAKDKELAEAGTSKKKQAEINKRYLKIEQEQAKERKRIVHEQAVMAKSMALVTAIVNTAAGVASQLTGGPGTGIALAIIAAALGAIEIATIIATKVPAAEKGTKSAPGGIMRVSEKGAELVRTPSGEMFTTPDRETLMNIPKGSEIIPHDEFMRAAMLATMPNYTSNSTQNNRNESDMMGFLMLNDSINRQRWSVNFDKEGMLTIAKGNQLFETYLNNYVRFNG
jgi:hypothetical protein